MPEICLNTSNTEFVTQSDTPKTIESKELDAYIANIELKQNEVILYHGTPAIFMEFKTPEGKSDMDVTKGGVIYFYDDPQRAAHYNGIKYVCVAKVTDPVPYAEQRQKQGLQRKKSKFTRGVWVALPENSKPIAFVLSDEMRTTRKKSHV